MNRLLVWLVLLAFGAVVLCFFVVIVVSQFLPHFNLVNVIR